MDDLYNNDKVWALFYRDGKTLGEICQEMGCGIYDLSPWLTKPLVNLAIDDKAKIRRMEKALRPFVKLEENYRSASSGDAVFSNGCIYVADLRNAREAVK